MKPSMPIFLHLSYHLKWFKSDDNGMFQCLLPISSLEDAMDAMEKGASSKYSFVHVHLRCATSPFLTIIKFCLELSLSSSGCSHYPMLINLTPLTKYIEHYVNLVHPSPILQGVGGKCLGHIRSMLLSF